MGSTLAFFLNLRVHQISTFFFSRHAFNFFFTRRDHKHKHALVVAFFHYFWKKAFTSTFAVFMTCDFFCIVLILEEVAHNQNVLCYIAHHNIIS